LFNLDECKIAKSLADNRLGPECRLLGSDPLLMKHFLAIGSNIGQTFNNPACHRWRAIFWPGYTAATLFNRRQRAASCSSKMISFSNINKQYGKNQQCGK
jgi:hypothetical protein